MLKADLQSVAEIIALFEAAGLRSRKRQLVTHTLGTEWQKFADKLALRADSFWPGYRTRNSPPAWLSWAPTPRKAPLSTSPKVIDFFVFER